MLRSSSTSAIVGIVWALAAIDGLAMLRVQGLRQLWHDWGAVRHPAFIAMQQLSLWRK